MPEVRELQGVTLGGRYECLRTLGRGGQGVVEEAFDTKTDRVVALKVRPIGPTAHRDLILEEARVLMALPPHPSIAMARSDFFDGDNHVLVMDFVDGPNLATALARAPHGLPPPEVARWLADVAAAVDHLHTQSPAVIHGDIKPANIVIEERDDRARAVLVDFGLATAELATLGRGTRAFAAPEAYLGETGPAGDLYALAATAHALLTGAPPIPGQKDTLAPALRAVIGRGLAIDPALRPVSAGAFAAELAGTLGVELPPRREAPAVVRRRRGFRLAAATVGLGALLAGLLVVTNDDGATDERDSRGKAGSEFGIESTIGSSVPPSAAPPPASLSSPPTIVALGETTPPTAARLARFALVARDGTVAVNEIREDGNVVAQRRTRTADGLWDAVAQIHPGHLLLYRRADGYARFTHVDGRGEVTIARQYDATSGFARIVTLDDRWLYFYAGNGYAGSARFDETDNFIGGAGYHDSRVINSGYDQLAFAGAQRVLHYDEASGKCLLIRIKESAAMQVLARPQLQAGWTVIAPTGGANVVAVDGAGVATSLRVSDAGVTIGERAPIGSGRFTTAAAFGRGAIVFDAASGEGRVLFVERTGSIVRVVPFTAAPESLLAAVD